MASVTLVELDANNWRECACLQVTEEQARTFGTSVFRIAQARFDPSLCLCAVYNSGGIMVGFVIYAHRYKPRGMEREPEGHWSLVHLMIDRDHQRMGYGRAVVEEVIKRVRSSGSARVLSLSFALDNIAARSLYTALGFRETGEMNVGERVARLWFAGEVSH